MPLWEFPKEPLRSERVHSYYGERTESNVMSVERRNHWDSEERGEKNLPRFELI